MFWLESCGCHHDMFSEEDRTATSYFRRLRSKRHIGAESCPMKGRCIGEVAVGVVIALLRELLEVRHATIVVELAQRTSLSEADRARAILNFERGRQHLFFVCQP